MATWVCPDCNRTFGSPGRSHICKPGSTLEELADSSIPTFRPIADRVIEHLRSLPGADEELIVDPLDELVQFKRDAMFAMLRPMTKWSALSFNLHRTLDSGRLSRKVIEQRGSTKRFHTINLHDVDEVDDEILGWLTEAYDPTLTDTAPGPSDGDPMVPDDVDIW
ncbi:MAG: DUF5655 domain-containing protein [Actinomycetota bacterium]